MQILGNHPASPGSGMFLDLPAGNFLFADNNAMITPATEHQFLQYNTATSPQEDCQSSHDYIYGHQAVVKTEFSNEQFAAMAPTYMMSMARSFSDGQLSQICGSDVTGIATTTVKTEMCDSPLMYAQQGLYDDDNSYNMNNSNLYSNQQQPQHHQHHHHSYSTSSLSTFSDSSMSPRSNFSSPNNSLTSYPLSRTLSEPLFHQGMMSTSSSMSDLARLGSDSDATITSNKPTPKRSRGRRVSNHPDTSGCKVFTCRVEDCGKIFKRSEHLKRHVRSIHTLEKPFPCPIQNCPKRFSRSDNLNQHIRIHRHNSSRCSTSEKSSKDFA
ncbi:zf-C2H2 Zinc finger, C2H2 type, partial [Entomortierella beljakovae]